MKVFDLNLYRIQRQSMEASTGLSALKSKVAVSASLASVVILATLGNAFIFTSSPVSSESPQFHGRGIASVEISDSGEKSGWFRDFLKSREGKIYESRSVAAIAEKPSLMDQLRFGDLEGKYSVRVEAGELREIQFVDNDSSQDRPKYVVQAQEFLKRYQGLHGIAFNEVRQTRSAQLGSSKVEVYEMLDQSAVKGMVEVTTDESGRLMNLRILEAH